MNISANSLQQTLSSLMCADIKVVKRGERLIVRAPFLFPDGDPYILYVTQEVNGAIRLSDAGHTMMYLSYENDIDKFKQGTRGKIFEQVIAQNDVTETNGELSVLTSPDGIGSAIFRLGQTITSISDISFLNKARIESTFYEDLSEMLFGFLDSEKVVKDYVYPEIENAADYPIDYRIEGKFDQLFIFGIPSKDKARLATIVLERLLRARAAFDSLLIFADQGQIPRADLARLSNAGGEMVASLDAVDDLKRKLARKVNF